MATLTIADLDNGKRDLQTVSEVANSRAAAATTRFGQQTTTLYESIRRINAAGDAQLASQDAYAREVISNLGFRVPVPYASGLDVTDSRFTVTGPDGKVYAPLSAPFTTGAWDPTQWYVLQNDMNDHKLLIFEALLEAEVAAATLPDGQVVVSDSDEVRGVVSAGSITQEQSIYKVADYAKIRSYTGRGTRLRVVDPTGAHWWVRKGTAADNGGTILKDGSGRSWVREYSGSVNALWFGAKGDGDANDTSAINFAIKAVEIAGGGCLDIPPGRYNLPGSIVVNQSNVRLIGAGRDATILLPSTDTSCIIFDFGETAKGGWGVESLTIRYSAEGTQGSAISSLNGLSGAIRDIYIERCFNGIQLGNSQATHVEHVEIWHNTRFGVFLSGNLNDVYLTEVFINGAQYGGSTPGPSSVGIYADGKAHAIMANNIEIVQSKSPMQLSGSALSDLSKPAFSTFVNCFFDSSSEEVLLNNCRNLKFIGCWFSNRASGCVVTNSVDTSFIGCSFVNNNMDGCIVQSSSTHTRFTDCTFDSNGQSSANTYAGLTIAPGASDWQVIGGFFGNLGVFPGTQAMGIRIGAGAGDRYVIRDASFSGNISGAVSNGSTGATYYIEGNLGYKTTSSGLASIASGATSVTLSHNLGVTPKIHEFQLTRASGNAGSVDLYVSNITSTQFTINTAPAPVANMLVSWMARCSGA